MKLTSLQIQQILHALPKEQCAKEEGAIELTGSDVRRIYAEDLEILRHLGIPLESLMHSSVLYADVDVSTEKGSEKETLPLQWYDALSLKFGGYTGLETDKESFALFWINGLTGKGNVEEDIEALSNERELLLDYGRLERLAQQDREGGQKR